MHPKEVAWQPVARVLRMLAVPAGVFYWILSGGAFGQRRLELALMASGIEVGKDSFPDIQAAIQRACAQLDFDPRVRTFVRSGADDDAQLLRTSRGYFLVLSSGLLAKLTPTERDFVVGYFLGAIKARHLHFHGVDALVTLASRLWVVRWIYLPLIRATVLTGDRIGMHLCGDPRAACSGLAKLLFGDALPGDLRQPAVVAQRTTLSRSPLAWWMRLSEVFPFPVERYDELAEYAARIDHADT